jgi:hypothetical protein
MSFRFSSLNSLEGTLETVNFDMVGVRAAKNTSFLLYHTI